MGDDLTTSDRSIDPQLVWVLFLGAFTMGTCELIAVGLVPEYARRASVSTEVAGGAVGAYALGMFAVGPVLALATTRVRMRPTLMISCAAFIVGCLASLAPSVVPLYAGRLLAGAAQGVFLATSFQLVGALLPPAALGPPIARILAGISVASAVGLPAGTALGTRLGIPAVTLIIIAAAVAALIGVVRWAPDAVTTQKVTLSEELAAARRPATVLRLLGLALIFAATFTVVTQMAAFAAERGLRSGLLAVVLLGVGVGAVSGTLSGGFLASRERLTFRVVPIMLAGALLVLLVASSPWSIVAGAGLLALVAFAAIPPVQTHCTTASRGRLVPALPASAINAGIAGGSALAGSALPYGADRLIQIALVVAGLAAVALFAAARRTVSLPTCE